MIYELQIQIIDARKTLDYDLITTLFSLSEQHFIFMTTDIFKPSLQKLSGVLNITGNSSAIFVVFFKLY
jgi:hypothetical protein